MATKPTLPPSIWAENRPTLPPTTDSQWGRGFEYTSTTSGGKALTETFDYPLFKIDESLRWLRDLFDDNGVISGLPDATETQKGVVEKATTSEAESGATDKFPDAAGVHAAFNSIEEQIGVNQSWQDVTSSRSRGVTYTNTTGRPIMIAYSGNPDINTSIKFFVNGSNIIELDDVTTGTVLQGFTAIVPESHTYRVENTDGFIGSWWELR